jgi:hypothetical protein
MNWSVWMQIGRRLRKKWVKTVTKIIASTPIKRPTVKCSTQCRSFLPKGLFRARFGRSKRQRESYWQSPLGEKGLTNRQFCFPKLSPESIFFLSLLYFFIGSTLAFRCTAQITSGRFTDSFQTTLRVPDLIQYKIIFSDSISPLLRLAATFVEVFSWLLAEQVWRKNTDEKKVSKKSKHCCHAEEPEDEVSWRQKTRVRIPPGCNVCWWFHGNRVVEDEIMWIVSEI